MERERNKITSVCVYCASSTQVASAYREAATELGHLLGERNLRVINGAGNSGLMCAVSDAALAAGGTGHRGRAVHRAERAGEQHDEGRAQQGGSAFRRPSRLPLHARRPQSQKCEKPRIAEKNRGVKVNLPPRNLEKSKNAEYICTPKCGSSSVVEHQLPKLRVAGSTPVSRS